MKTETQRSLLEAQYHHLLLLCEQRGLDATEWREIDIKDLTNSELRRMCDVLDRILRTPPVRQ